MKRNMKKYKGTQSLCRGEGDMLGIFLGPKGYMGEGRQLGIFSSPKAPLQKESSEFFQVPKPI